MKTAELTGTLLDYYVTRTQPIILNTHPGFWEVMDDNYVILGYIGGDRIPQYSPSTDWAHGGPLIERWGVSVEEIPPAWWAHEPGEPAMFGETPLEAICRVVVRAAFGDEVEDI